MTSDAGTGVDVLLVGGRVIDPETGFDEVATVGLRAGRIVHVGARDVTARETLDVSGLVVAPGFIDLHSHAQSLTGHRLQAFDGVTTSLELEDGANDFLADLEHAGVEGRPLNFGFSASWAGARLRLLDGVHHQRSTADGSRPLSLQADRPGEGGRWDQLIDDDDVARLVADLREQVRQGALGVGVLLGYAPETGHKEYFAIAEMAAAEGVPVFTHSRGMSVHDPVSSLEGTLEVLAAAAGSGAHLHLCHVNSTSTGSVETIVRALARARQQGLRITTEAYPYGAGSTVVGAAFLAPDSLERFGLTPASVALVRTGEAARDVEELRALRAEDPSALSVVTVYDEQDPDDLELLLRLQTIPGAAVASDAVPIVWSGPAEGREDAEAAVRAGAWPLPEGFSTHPRSTGCYAKVFRWLVRELGVLSLPEAVARCSYVPATILADVAPAAARKGRIQVGADADLVVFDAATFADRSDHRTTRTSEGVRHLFVGGQRLIADGVLDTGLRPGRAVLGHPSTTPGVSP